MQFDAGIGIEPADGHEPRRRKGLAGKAVLTAALLAGTAFAHTAPPQPLRNSVTIQYVGSISPTCAMSFDQLAFQMGVVEPNKTADVTFKVNCNEPYKITLASANGGLLGPAIPTDKGFSNLVRYELDISIPGGPSIAGCSSAILRDGDLSSCRVMTSGDSVANALSGTARLKLTPGATEAFVAGDYADTITISIEPRGV